VLREPHAILGTEELVPFAGHLARVHLDDTRSPATPPYGLRYFARRGEVDVMALPARQAVDPDGVEKALHGAVVQERWRGYRRIAKVHFDRMTLIGTNPTAIRAEREPLLVAVANELFEARAIQRAIMAREGAEECLHIDPSTVVEHEAYRARLVAEYPAQELRGGPLVH
jgi:hypothetical protein